MPTPRKGDLAERDRKRIEILKKIEDLPGCYVLEDTDAALVLDISKDTLKRRSPVPKIMLSERRHGRRVDDIRRYLRGELTAA
jgi:hypothetical protein